MLSHRLKGKWSLRRRQGFHSTPSNYSSFAVTPHCSPIWYNLHSYFVCQRERKSKGLYFTHKYPFLAIHAKGRESISPSKRTAPPPISKMQSFKFVLKEGFSICILFLIESSNWYDPFQN